MLIILTAEIGAGKWFFEHDDSVEAFVRSNLKRTVRVEYGKVESRTKLIDHLQENLQCCGVTTFRFYIRIIILMIDFTLIVSIRLILHQTGLKAATTTLQTLQYLIYSSSKFIRNPSINFHLLAATKL